MEERKMERVTLFKPVLLMICAALASLSPAEVFEWNGGEGEYTEASNWTPASVPDLAAGGNTAKISSGAVTYTPGGDLVVHNGSTLQISGGSFIQLGGIAWMQMAGGHLLVDGGTFNQGECANIVRDAASSITVSAGTANFSGSLMFEENMGDFIISGTGVVQVENEFKPIKTFTITGGTLRAVLVSLSDGPGSLEISGGRVEIDGSAVGHGVYRTENDGSISFTRGSTGTLFVKNMTLDQFRISGFLSNGAITYKGKVNSSSFDVVEVEGGVEISLYPVDTPSPFSF
jgi:hypothetical protein